MDDKIFDSIIKQVRDEPYAKKMGIEPVELDAGYSKVKNIKPPSTGDVLYAEAREVSRSGRIGTYAINVKNEGDNVIAICQALAYRKRDKLPFLD